jgi:hypothetical protein
VEGGTAQADALGMRMIPGTGVDALIVQL